MLLFSNRRVALIHFCLAGMEIAWFTPLVLIFYAASIPWSSWAVYAALLATLITWMLAIELVNRQDIKSPYYELAVVVLIAATSLLLVRVLLYPAGAAGSGWLRTALAALPDFESGVRPELALVLANLFLWQRAASATGREVAFFNVGLSFRLGMLLAILTAALLRQFGGMDARPFLWLYFALGLTAVAVARIHDKALGARSSGKPLPPGRLAQVILAVGVTVAIAAALTRVFTPEAVGAALSRLQPVGVLLGILLLKLVELLFWLLMPLLSWLEERLRGLDLSAAAEALQRLEETLGAAQAEAPAETAAAPPWVGVLLRDLAIVALALLALGFVLLYLDRIRQRRGVDEAEDAAGENLSLGGAALLRGVDRLRNLAALVRRFGLSSQLLAAVSVQNLYANLCRLARQRGYPRRPAQPPDSYLPMLAQAFGGQEDALERLTAAYMRVHYGDRPVGVAELAQLRADYEQVRQSEPRE